MLRHRLPLLLLLLLPGLAAGSDLIFYADFDHGPISVCGSGWAVDMPTASSSFVAGRFGQAYRMERQRTNLLSPNQADIESDTSGFEAGPGIELAADAGAARFGTQSLRAAVAEPGLVWKLPALPVQATARIRPNKVFVFSAYLRSETPLKVRLSLVDLNESAPWREKIEQDNAAALAKDPNAKPKPILETVQTPGEVVLTPTWQRVMALLEIDVRRPEQSLVASLEALPGESGHDELIEFLRGHLARYKVPKSVVFVEALPKTGAGKIDKKALAQQFGQPEA